MRTYLRIPGGRLGEADGYGSVFFVLPAFFTSNKLSAYRLPVIQQSGDIESQKIVFFFRVTL